MPPRSHAHATYHRPPSSRSFLEASSLSNASFLGRWLLQSARVVGRSSLRKSRIHTTLPRRPQGAHLISLMYPAASFATRRWLRHCVPWELDPLGHYTSWAFRYGARSPNYKWKLNSVGSLLRVRIRYTDHRSRTIRSRLTFGRSGFNCKGSLVLPRT